MKEYSIIEQAEKKITLTGVQACVTDDLLRLALKLKPQEKYYEHSGNLSSLSLAVSVSDNAEAVTAAFSKYASNRLVQVELVGVGEAKAQAISLSDSDMDTICALWLLYKIKMSSK